MELSKRATLCAVLRKVRDNAAEAIGDLEAFHESQLAPLVELRDRAAETLSALDGLQKSKSSDVAPPWSEPDLSLTMNHWIS